MSFKSSFTTSAVAAISFCLIGGTTPAYADLGDQLHKLLPKDGAANDQFGHSVAISGTTAIVGANADADNGFGSGSAYLFDISDPADPRQIAKLLPDDGAAFDSFGSSIAINGASAIVGAAGNDDNGSLSGSAYLFDISDPANPTQIVKLLPDDGAGGDFFGRSVAISGTTVIVGAGGDDDNGTDSGSAYLFDTTTGRQIAKLLPDDGGAGHRFGFSLAISGPIAIVGAWADDDNGSASGSAYLFDISDPVNPTQIAKLLANDGSEGDLFGRIVAICNATAIVGAPYDADNGNLSGSAYLFDISDPANPTQIVKLLPDDGAVGDSFGGSVGIGGSTAIVGANWDDDNGNYSGSAYLFDASSCPWDLDGTGSVGASDLLSLLATWGPCKGCSADFDSDGTVGASDLLTLLANWGPCS